MEATIFLLLCKKTKFLLIQYAAKASTIYLLFIRSKSGKAKAITSKQLFFLPSFKTIFHRDDTNGIILEKLHIALKIIPANKEKI